MSIRLVPKWVEGRNKREAQLRLLAYQAKFTKQCNVVNIYEDKSGKVIIWFMDELSNLEVAEAIESNGTESSPRRS